MEARKKKELFERLTKLTKDEKPKREVFRDRSGEIVHRLNEMEKLVEQGKTEQRQKTKKDLWTKLSEQAKKKQSL